MNHQQITEARILGWLTESNEREARAKADYNPREIPLNHGLVALVDEEDYERVIQEGRWYAVRGKHTHYARRSIPGGIVMHRFITGWTSVDHIDGDGLNNQRSNLRQATTAQNNLNKRTRRDSKSGFKGLTFRRDCRRPWLAMIQRDGVSKRIGYFDSRQEAAAAYDLVARDLFGEFAWLNFPGGEASPLGVEMHTYACAAFSAALYDDAPAACRLLDNLDHESVVAALKACVEFSLALGQRLNRLRALERTEELQQLTAMACLTPDSPELPSCREEPCAYCGRADCGDRWQHDREHRGHEVTIWKAAKS